MAPSSFPVTSVDDQHIHVRNRIEHCGDHLLHNIVPGPPGSRVQLGQPLWGGWRIRASGVYAIPRRHGL